MRRHGVRGVVIAVLALLALAPVSASADQVVRFNTTLGNIDVRLLSNDAPNTVQNFLSYVNSGAYNNTVIQRAVHNFVFQGGGYQFDPTYVPPTGSGGVANFRPITAQAPIQNEFKDSNVRGTIAMALSGSNANSATNQWFFNVADNSSLLDPQKFTVFGRVINDSSLAVMDAIANSFIDTTDPSPNRDVSSGSGVPLVNQSAGLTATNLIYVNSITVINYPPPTVTISKPADKSVFAWGQTVTPVFSCSDAGGPGLASCSGAKTLDTSLFGTFDYTVTATDKAGTTATKSISYIVIPYFIPKAPKPKAPLVTPPFHTTPGGQVSLGLLCTASVRCVGKLRLLTGRKHTLVASARYSVGQGHTFEQTLRLNKTGRSLLGRRHGTLAVTIALTPSGTKHTKKQKLTLRVKPSSRHTHGRKHH
jgi:cyclophilin family peptidyl-prolyl cis-trans isomerase